MSDKCKNCQFYVHTTTLGSLDKEIWHCRFGFTPTKDCQKMGEYNMEIINKGLGEYMHSPIKSDTEIGFVSKT